MNLSPPTTAVFFVISLILAVLAIIGTFVAIPLISTNARWVDPGRGRPLQGRITLARASGWPAPSEIEAAGLTMKHEGGVRAISAKLPACVQFSDSLK